MLVKTKQVTKRRRLPGRASAVVGRIAPGAFGIATGAVIGVVLALATVVLLLRGGELVGPHLSLLGNYLPGYSVSWMGVAVGLVEGFVIGFVVGFLFAMLRNLWVMLYLRFVWTRFQHHVANDLLDRLS
jgi:hypothetical protein